MNPGQIGTLIPLLAICVGGLIAVVSIIAAAARSIAVGRARENTKRKLAAYVAEGSIDPDKAIAMLNAGVTNYGDMVVINEKDKKASCCAGSHAVA